MNIYIASISFGLVSAAVLAVAALGFTMQFGITDVLNLSYGAVLIAGAYLTYELSRHGISVWIGLAASGVMGALLSLLLNRIVYAPFARRRTSHIGMVIVTLAVGIILQNVLLGVAGPNAVSINVNPGRTLQWGGLKLTTVQLIIIGISVVTMIAIHALLTYSRLGKAMRATAANSTLAKNCGIATGRIVNITWLLTGALCGMSGTIFGIDSGSFTPSSAGIFLVVVLAAAIVGGVGSPYGAMVGALLIGLATELSAAAISPAYKQVIAFAMLVAVMVLRPQGLLVRRAAA